jgi:S-adenosylmethionine:tRNA ribosyltransferase-isomerase
MKTEDFKYDLPRKFIAQSPAEPRDLAKLLVLKRDTGQIEHTRFYKIGDYLKTGDLLVLNETRVISGRLFGKKDQTGGKVEILLLKKIESNRWECLVGGKGVNPGMIIEINSGPTAEITKAGSGSLREIQFEKPIDSLLDRIGSVPLPPYIKKTISDPERYQTVYAKDTGSSAAPTAGLHFTTELLESMSIMGIKTTFLTLHIGLDTFAPVVVDDPRNHQIHSEFCSISEETAELVNQTRMEGGRIIAVGTTSVRALESAAGKKPKVGYAVSAYEGITDLYILPGYDFRIVDIMITNFHLPGSTLIMLVSAFAGREKILDAYEIAKEWNYRFYSFGDAMLIL